VGFEVNGWTSGGYLTVYRHGKKRLHRLWHDGTNFDWGILISTECSPTRTVEILEQVRELHGSVPTRHRRRNRARDAVKTGRASA